MTTNTFLPGLFFFQLVLGMVAGYCFFDGEYLVAGGVILVILMFTIPVDRAYSINPDRTTNGEIMTRLQQFSNERIRLYSRAMYGADVEAQIKEVNLREALFRSTIEYGKVADGAENYYSYRK